MEDPPARRTPLATRSSTDEVEEDVNNYTADTETDGVNLHNDRNHHQLRPNRQGMGRNQRTVHDHNDAFGKIKFTMPPFARKYDLDAYLTWELTVDQKFACHDFPEIRRVRATICEFTDFAFVWWKEHCRQYPNNIPNTWEALKLLMWHRFVPSYYALHLLNKFAMLTTRYKVCERLLSRIKN